MNKIRIPAVITIVASALFTLLSVNFSFDISLLSFPVCLIGTGFLFYYLYKKVILDKDFSSVKVALKLLQYIPFILLAGFIVRRAGENGTNYAYDVVTVVLWCVVFVFSLYVLHYLNEKRVFLLEPEWKKLCSEKKGSGIIASKKITGKSFVFEILDWLDALVQAVFMVLLIQIFVLQLYVIPSESMVPSFLIGDRVVVTKTPSGPKFPLSNVGFPCLKRYKRGDVVVFRNPHYSMDRKSEVRSVVSQIVYMLTFTGINLNVDEYGSPKADPLVKRICGVPGEQLMMQDGTLYSRTVASDEFKPVEFDSRFACWNLAPYAAKYNNSKKKMIKEVPLSQNYYDLMIGIEEARRNLDVKTSGIACEAIVKTVGKYAASVSGTSEKTLISLDEYELFASFYSNTKKICSDGNCFVWFKKFMTDWTFVDGVASSALFNGDLYAEANFRLNVMFKLAAGRLYERCAQLMANNVSEEEIYQDEKIIQCLSDAQKLHFYASILDQRNMPVFPSSLEDGTPQYIPENCYFMMGDNRFNSLDMRHSYEIAVSSLTGLDDYSVEYKSDMAPQFVNRNRILGAAVYRFYPAGRVGPVRTK